jgi:response regulator NasT
MMSDDLMIRADVPDPKVHGIPHHQTMASNVMGDSTLTILLIEENPVRAAILEEGMRQSGYAHVIRISDMVNLPDKICAADPDVVVIGLENASRDTLEQMFQVSRTVRRPIAMFVDNDDGAMIQAAVDAGVSAYVVNGLSKERVRPIVDITILRFHAFRRLEEELAQAKEALEARKIIERAIGILMQQQRLSEDEAYKLMRRTAMSQKRKLLDIAQSVVTAAQLFPRG